MDNTLSTDRFSLTPLDANHIPDLHLIYSDDTNIKFMQSPPHTDLEQTKVSIEKSMETQGGIDWVIRLNENDSVIGRIRFFGQIRIPRLNYIIHHKYLDQEIATEACRLALAYGFDTLGYDRIELWLNEQDDAASHVAHKIGFKVKGRLVSKYAKNSHHHMMSIWGIHASDWQGNELDTSEAIFHSAQVILPVRDVLATAEFYRDSLGFQIDFLYGNPPAHGGVSRGSWSSNIIAFQLSPIPPDVETISQVSLNIRISGDIDALYEEYRASGVTILSEPGDKPWGFREFAIEDINGHLLVIGTPK